MVSLNGRRGGCTTVIEQGWYADLFYVRSDALRLTDDEGRTMTARPPAWLAEIMAP